MFVFAFALVENTRHNANEVCTPETLMLLACFSFGTLWFTCGVIHVYMVCSLRPSYACECAYALGAR